MTPPGGTRRRYYHLPDETELSGAGWPGLQSHLPKPCLWLLVTSLSLVHHGDGRKGALNSAWHIVSPSSEGRWPRRTSRGSRVPKSRSQALTRTLPWLRPKPCCSGVLRVLVEVPADPQHTAAPRRQRRVKKQVTLCCAGALFQNFPSVVFPNKARESESIVVSLGKLT